MTDKIKQALQEAFQREYDNDDDFVEALDRVDDVLGDIKFINKAKSSKKLNSAYNTLMKAWDKFNTVADV